MKHTQHAKDRMRQRAIPADMVHDIIEHGEWNGRGDRVCVSRKTLEDRIKETRRTLKHLETLQRRGGGTVVLEGEDVITVYANTKRLQS